MTEPRTSKGRDFLFWWGGRSYVTVALDYATAQVLLIEAEAESSLRARLAAEVRDLPSVGRAVVNNEGWMELPDTVDRAAVLQVIAPESETT